MKEKTIPKLLISLFSALNYKRKVQLGLVTVFMFLASLSEVVSIGAVLPFLSVLMNPETIYSHKLGQYFFGFFGFDEPNQIILPTTIIFGLVVLLAGIIRIALLYASTRLSFAIGADLSFEIFKTNNVSS